MNKRQHLLFITLTSIAFFGSIITADLTNETTNPVIPNNLTDINLTNEIIQQAAPKIVTFSYENEDLVNVINYLASLKEANVILPQGANEIKAKLSLKIEKELSIDEAWNLLITILDIAGYSLAPKEKTDVDGKPKQDMFVVVKNTKDIAREPMPIYVGIQPEKLPDTDQRIRYLYYLANIKVTDAADSEVNTILKNILPADALFKSDSATNALLITAKVNDIRAVMKIIIQLDSVGFHEKMEIIKLRNSSAGIVAKLINENILKTTDGINRYRLDTKKKRAIPYFSKFTKVFPEQRTNSLIVLGRSQAVDRLKEFILTYIDSEPESGKSILHVYQLQYLDAETFAPTLQDIVEFSRTGGTGQAKAGEKFVGGTERFFDQVIIKVDKPEKAEELKYYGGNKLIIAARNEDWRQIKKLIEELDTPQPQVLIEVLIVDLTLDDTRLLGALTRTPDKIPLPSDLEFQSAHINPQIIADEKTDPTTIHADLLSRVFDDSNNFADPAKKNNSAAVFATTGSTLLALNDNDGQTWSILQLLKLFTHSKILSHPHIIATNNKKAEVTIAETRLLRDDVSGSLGGTSVRKFKEIKANLTVAITPRISTAETVNLEVVIDINEFIAGTDAKDAQTIRKVETNANIKSGSIFALGGLIRVSTGNSVNETPILSKIPILGWFFKRRQKTIRKNNLTVFICPTIIEPRLRKGMSEYTTDYINVTTMYAKEGALFDTLKQPITRWFFKTGNGGDAAEVLDAFVSKDQGNVLAQETKPKGRRKKNKRKKEYKLTHNQPKQQKKEATPTINVTHNSTSSLKTLLKNEESPF